MPIPTESRSNSKQQVSVGATSISAPKMGVILFLLLTLVIISFFPSSLTLHQKWFMSGEGYSHGYLLLSICIYLVFEKRDLLQQAVQRPRWILAFPLTVLCLTWVVLNLAGIQTLQQLLMPIIFLTVCGLVFGLRFAIILTPIISFIFLGIPIWDYAIPLLQAMAVAASRAGLTLMSLPVFIKDIWVTVPGGQFEIAGGCSGLRYLLVSLTLSALYGFLSYSRLWKILALIIFAATMSLVFNWLRILIIIYAGYATQMKHSLVSDHDNFGWLIFAISLIPLFFVARKLESNEEIEKSILPDAKNETEDRGKNNSSFKTPYMAIIVALLLTSIAPATLIALDTQNNKGNQLAFKFPLYLKQWDYKGRAINNWLPHYENAEKIITGSYHSNQSNIDISIHHYFNQNQDNELIYYLNRVLNLPWKEHINTGIELTVPPKETYVNIIIANENPTNGKKLKSVIYWYEVAGNKTTTELGAKWLQIVGLFNTRRDAALISISSDCEDIDCANANEQIKAFYALLAPSIEAHFNIH